MPVTPGTLTSVLEDVGNLVSRVSQSAKLGVTDVVLWRKYSSEVVKRANELDVQQSVKLLGAFSYMRYRHRSAMDALAARLCEACFKLNSVEIARALRSYSVLEHRSDFMFRLMLPEIAKRLEVFALGDLASVFYSYSNMGYYNRHLTNCVESAVMRNVAAVKPRELCHLLCALGKLRVRRQRLETVLGCHFCKTVVQCSPAEFAMMVNALGRLDFCGHPHLFSVVETEVYRTVKHLPPASFALVANAVSRREESVKVVNFLARESPARLREFNLHSICLLSSAFSRRGDVRSELFEKMAESVGRISMQLSPRAIASLSFAYARAGHLHGPLMHFAGLHLERYPALYSCNEAAMVMRAHNVLGIRNESMLLSLAQFVCATYPDLVPVEPADTLQSERVSVLMYTPTGAHVNQCESQEGCGDGTPTDHTDGAVITSEEETEHKHINHLEIVLKDPFGDESRGKNFLERGLMHSLLWIAQSFAQHGVWNDREVKGALQRIANEVACRPRELTPLTTAQLLYAYARLNYRLDALIELLSRELRDPRLHFQFEQSDLRAVFHALVAFGIEPSTAGVYKVPTIELKRLMEVNGNNVDRVVAAILAHEYETQTAADPSEALELEVPLAGDRPSTGNAQAAVTYVHIPACVGTAAAEGRSASAFAERLKYNFAI